MKKAAAGTRFLMRSYGTPEQEFDCQDQAFRAKRYELLFQLANGIAYDDKDLWSDYRKTYGLYRFTRHIWDSARPLIDFYQYRVWNGVVPDDGMNLPHGLENAVPLSPETPPELARAVSGMLHDWAFEDRCALLVETTATVGELLLELIDDPRRGRIDMELTWPAYVRDISLDPSGEIEEYVLEYWVRDQEYSAGTDSLKTIDQYVYRKEVTRDYIRTYKNREPYGYDGLPAEIENPYGFVPAVWFRHHRRLGVRGEPAISATMGATDEVNSLISHLVDKTHVALRSPVVVSGNLTLGSLTRSVGELARNVKRAVTETLTRETDLRQEQDILEAPQGTKIDTVQVDLTSAMNVTDFVKTGIEKRSPEVMVFEEIRKMTQITGPAADRLFGDVVPKFKSISAGSYDRPLIRALQKSIAMAGWRVNNGDWDGTRAVDDDGVPIGGLTERQQRFLPYNLGSYGRGELSLTIMPRKLFAETEAELLAVETTKRIVLPSMPEQEIAKELGYDSDTVQKWIADAEKRQQAELQAQRDHSIELASVQNKQNGEMMDQQSRQKAMIGNNGGTPR